jgi:Na+:H+ antiporter, NhaA family
MPGRPSIHGTWLHSDRFVPRRFVRPVLRFTEIEAAGGIVLLAAALAALVWANSPWAPAYQALWETSLSIDLGLLRIDESLREGVNDGLMAIFFFVIGLEIKRELVAGELRDPRTAALPALAALGGMVAPALIYLAVAGGGEAARGWGIPMATDIAFSLGVVALLGNRVPVGAKLFLLALAIVDDIGVIAVIALFYTGDLSLPWLAAGLVGLVTVAVAAEVGIRSMTVYMGLGVLTWLAFLESGVHATIAGVALGLLTPARPMYDDEQYFERATAILERYRDDEAREWSEERIDDHALTLAGTARESVSPLNRLERALHPWTSFVIIPIFALANAGVRLEDVGGALASPVALGVGAGLLVGKTVGISLFAFLAVRLGLGRLPIFTAWRHLVGIAMLAGIGFTVSLFVAGLAFADPELAERARVGIFAGSTLSGLAGYLWLRLQPTGRS